MNTSKTVLRFEMAGIGISVEEMNLNGKIKYQATYDTGEQIAEMESDKKSVLKKALRVIKNTVILLG